MSTPRRLLPLVVLAVLAWGPPASAVPLPAGSTALLTGTSSLFDAFEIPVNHSRIGPESVSQDGRYVAFESTSDGLLEGDNDRRRNIYVKDRVTGAVTLVSRATGVAGEPAGSDCEEPAISDDGTRVAFTCRAALDPADTNGVDDVYVRDLTTTATILVSRASGLGAVGDQGSRDASLSQTGEYVAFASDAKNFGTPGGELAYRRRIGAGDETIAVSRRTGSSGATEVSGAPSISDDGNRVAFVNRRGFPIDAADTNLFDDVYVRDVAAGTTVLASRADGAGAVGNGDSTRPVIAGNGLAVAFESEANQFDFANDSDPAPDIYRRSLTSGATALVSINAGGAKGIVSTAPSIDDSGDVIAFVSQATGLHPDDTAPSEDVYLKSGSAIDIASRADGAGGRAANASARVAAVSGDGTKTAFASGGAFDPAAEPRRGGVFLRDASAQRTFNVARPPGDAPFRNAGGSALNAAVSADARYAAIATDAPGLGVTDDMSAGIVVRDRVTGEVTLASRADGADGAPLKATLTRPAISADGRRVAFQVSEGPQRDIYVRDVVTGRTFLASRADGAAGASGNGASSDPALDADGSRVTFTSTATNLGDGDTDAVADVHLRDLATDQTLLVSRADGPAGAKGNGASSGGDVDDSGTRVSFTSAASNLTTTDTDTQQDVHLRDLQAGTTRLVSASAEGVKANAPSGVATIDGAGTRVAFHTPASNLLGVTTTLFKVFVRDVGANTLVLASRADGGDGAPADSHASLARISPDGGYVGFESQATNLAPGTPAGLIQVYRRDLAAAQTVLVSRRTGDGAAAAVDARNVDLSRDGACVSFTTSDGLIGSTGDLPQAYLRVFVADCGDPVAAGGGGGAGDDAGPQGDGARDTVAPVLSGARLSRKRFRVGRARTARVAKVKKGAVLRFRSTEPATLTIAVQRRAGKRFRRAGRLTRRIGAGPGRVALSGRIGKRALKAGRHRLKLVAVDSAGNRSRPVRLRFRVVGGGK